MMPHKYSGTSVWRLSTAISVIALAMIVYHLAAVWRIILPPMQHQNFHYGLALLLVFLGAIQAKPKLWLLFTALALLGLVSTGYVHILYSALEARAGIATQADTIVGFALVAVAIAGSWITFGPVLPLTAGLFIAYAFLGQYLPSTFYHYPISASTIATHMSIGLMGMYGVPLGASANLVFLFMILGALFEVTGVTTFFGLLASTIGGKLRGGVILSPVISSSLVGMVTGQASSNVAITGVATIPAMKNAGLRPEQAAAWEAMASSGGQITPPIMGASAFLMAAYLSVPYIQVVKWAILPAALYYWVLAVGAVFQGGKQRIAPLRTELPKGELPKRAMLFVVPFSLIVMLLLNGFTPARAAFWAIASLLVLSVARGQTRPSRQSLLRGARTGAVTGAGIAMACAVLGPIMATMTVTGLGQKIAFSIEMWSSGVLPVGLVLTAAVSLLLGTGLPTMAAYLLVALIASPALVRMGISVPQAHFFALYFAVFSYITPPVALAALIAARMSGASFAKTCWTCARIGWPCFLIPFLFMIYPELMLGLGSKSTALIFISCLLGTFHLMSGTMAYSFAAVGPRMRLLFVSCGFFLLLNPSLQLVPTAAGLAIGMALVFAPLLRRIRAKKTSEHDA